VVRIISQKKKEEKGGETNERNSCRQKGEKAPVEKCGDDSWSEGEGERGKNTEKGVRAERGKEKRLNRGWKMKKEKKNFKRGKEVRGGGERSVLGGAPIQKRG